MCPVIWMRVTRYHPMRHPDKVQLQGLDEVLGTHRFLTGSFKSPKTALYGNWIKLTTPEGSVPAVHTLPDPGTVVGSSIFVRSTSAR